VDPAPIGDPSGGFGGDSFGGDFSSSFDG
jgi:hypothetical protein